MSNDDLITDVFRCKLMHHLEALKLYIVYDSITFYLESLVWFFGIMKLQNLRFYIRFKLELAINEIFKEHP